MREGIIEKECASILMLISDLRKTYMYVSADDQIVIVTAVRWIWKVLVDGIDSTMNKNNLTVSRIIFIYSRVMP